MKPMREDTEHSLEMYYRHGIEPGGFLTACLENNLHRAFERADDESIEELHAIVAFMHNELPAAAWGSPAAVEEWLSNDILRRAILNARGVR